MKKQILVFVVIFLSLFRLYSQISTEDYNKEIRETFEGKWNCYYLDNDYCRDYPSSRKLIAKNINFFIGNLSASAKFNYVINRELISEITLTVEANGATEKFQLIFTSLRISVNVIEQNQSGIKCMSEKSEFFWYSASAVDPSGVKDKGVLELLTSFSQAGGCCFVLERVSQ